MKTQTPVHVEGKALVLCYEANGWVWLRKYVCVPPSY